MKNILFVLNIYPGIGGIESVTNALADYLSRYYRVYTLSMSKSADVPVAKGVADSFLFPGEDVDINSVFFNKLIDERDISIVINQGMFLHISDVIFNVNHRQDVPVISCLHGMPMYEKHLFWGVSGVKIASRKRKFKWRMQMIFNRCKPYNNLLNIFKASYQTVFRNSKKTVLLCDDYIKPFCECYEVDNCDGKVIALPNPLPDKYSGVQPVGWDGKKDMILFVGRICPEKRVDLLLRLWHGVKCKGNWHMTIVGDGESLPQLKQLVQEMKIDQVDFYPFTNTPEIYYKKAKFIVLTSIMEGFGMCLIEGMRYGAVPVAFNMSSGVKSVIEGSGGILVPVNKQKKFVDVLNMITNGEYGNNGISQQSYAKSQNYTIEVVGAKWRELIESLT